MTSDSIKKTQKLNISKCSFFEVYQTFISVIILNENNNHALLLKTREDSPTIYNTKQSESDTWLPYFEQFVSEQKLKYFEEYFGTFLFSFLIFLFVTNLVYVNKLFIK